MVFRSQFVGYLPEGDAESLLIGEPDQKCIEALTKGKECINVSLYKYQDLLFCYLESTIETLTPDSIFPELTAKLRSVPHNEFYVKWKPMVNVYKTFQPERCEDLKREDNKIGVGKLGFLFTEKIPSYVYYHKALMDEGLYNGDKYLYISLLDNMLFLYSEEPTVPHHLNEEAEGESRVILEWGKQDPLSHFIREKAGGDKNFIIMDKLFSYGTFV